MSTVIGVLILAVVIATVIGAGIAVVIASTRPTHQAKIDRSLHTPDDEGYAPLPIDPAHPPSIRYYRPKKANPNARRTCHCHGRVIEMDQEIVWWPLPDGSVRLLCKDADMKGVVKEEPA